MAVAMLVDNPEARRRSTSGFGSSSAWRDPRGDLPRRRSESERGWRVIEVFESDADAQRFVERLKPAFEAVGVPGPPQPPEFWPVHSYMP